MNEETLRKEFEEWLGENYGRASYSALYSRMYEVWLESARRADKRNLDRIGELEAALKYIADYAHDNSTGPTVPDTLWEIRQIAYEVL